VREARKFIPIPWEMRGDHGCRSPHWKQVEFGRSIEQILRPFARGEFCIESLQYHEMLIGDDAAKDVRGQMWGA